VGGVPEGGAAHAYPIEESGWAERPSGIPLHGLKPSDLCLRRAISAERAVSKRNTRRWSDQIYFLQLA
jgi:hypothetical protein